MTIPIYQVDAFTGEMFRGNPAAVCPLERWLADERMQAIAAENNLSETAFFVPQGDDFALRWFTPKAEVDLCGHATLATAFVIFTRREPGRLSVRFHTRSGVLEVARDGDLLALDFPAWPPAPCRAPPALARGLGARPEMVMASGRDYLAVFADASRVKALTPDPARLAGLDRKAVIVTAPGNDCDFVSRFFAPALGVGEDPVTGSAHCTLVPYWAARLGKRDLHARQLSARGGELFCRLMGERVRIAGRAVLYMEGVVAL